MANRLKAELGTFAGVYQISDSFRDGKRQLELDIKPQAEILGLTRRDLARQVRQAFYGEEAQRIQRGRDDVRVMVRYPEDERRSLAGGLVTGLCERLELDPRVRELVAYVYALLDDEGAQALPVSRLMLHNPVPPDDRKAYEKGRFEAAAIVEMLAYHRKAV